MGFTLDAPESLAGESTKLTESGKFHLVVTGAYDGKYPPRRDGEEGQMMQGFCFSCEVMAGPQAGKLVDFSFYNGDLSHKDGGVFARKIQAAALIATDCLSVNDLGKKGVQIDLSQAVGAQVVAEIEIEEKEKNGKSYPTAKLSYANIFHVDDPRVAKVEKDQTAIDSIPKANRHEKEYFAPLTARKAPVKAAAPSPSVTDDDLKDL